MTKVNKTQEQHTAGPIAIGFDYQFYLFMSLALELGPGEKSDLKLKTIYILIKQMKQLFYIKLNIQFNRIVIKT